MMNKVLLAAVASVGLANAQTCECAGADMSGMVETAQSLASAFGLPVDFCTICSDLMVGCECKACFPADAEVLTAGNEVKQMGQLTVGDKVHVGRSQFDDVFLFTTEMEATTSKFVSLATAATEKPLRLTSGHYLYVNGELAQASDVKVGDMLTLANGNKAAVTEVSTAWAPGLYNPHTLNGDIVVDGVLTSTYTDAVNPTLAHALLLPLRQMYAAGATFGQGFSAMAKGVPSWIRQSVSA
jgi:hypothetical protein